MTPIVSNADSSQPTICRISAAVFALMLAGCSANLSTGGLASGQSGDAGSPFAERGQEQSRPVAKVTDRPAAGNTQVPRTVDELARAHAAEPSNVELTLAYARSLKNAGKRGEALALIEKAAADQPGQQPLLVEQGLLALELGKTTAAAKLLKAAGGDSSTDWRVVSAQGVAASGLGRQKDAQRHFARALKLSPDNPAVLNNMAMSLILDRKPDQAEIMLQRAAKAGAPREQVERNIALAKALKDDALGGGGQ